MPDGDLAVRVRDYARGRLEKRLFADGELAVSSAWLARELGVDPRTIAAALRPYGIRPAEVERGVRGYMVADLAGLELRDGPGTPDAATSGGDGVPASLSRAGTPSAEGVPPAREAVPPVSAIERLSVGAGHDMTPALRAAGLL
jgi:hypothetical protein